VIPGLVYARLRPPHPPEEPARDDRRGPLQAQPLLGLWRADQVEPPKVAKEHQRGDARSIRGRRSRVLRHKTVI